LSRNDALLFRTDARRSAIERAEQAKEAGKIGGRNHPKDFSLSDTVSDKLKPKKDTRKEVSKEYGISERQSKYAQKIDELDPQLSQMVRNDEINLVEAKKLSVHPETARKTAMAAGRPAGRLGRRSCGAGGGRRCGQAF
jgi:hypothetical protein